MPGPGPGWRGAAWIGVKPQWASPWPALSWAMLRSGRKGQVPHSSPRRIGRGREQSEVLEEMDRGHSAPVCGPSSWGPHPSAHPGLYRPLGPSTLPRALMPPDHA